MDVIFVNDNSADTDDSWPNGTEISQTYSRAQEVGLTKMPSIPDSNIIVAQKLNKQAFFLGCHDSTKVTIVFLPNQDWTFASNVGTTMFSFTPEDLASMIDNGQNVATQGGDKEWPICLACAITHKTAKFLPSECDACLQKYCIS